MMQFIVKGIFTIVVDANSMPEAKQTAERILRNDGIKAISIEATENNTGKRRANRGTN
jgi:hypothetical protein